MLSLDARLAAVAVTQAGLFTRAQAIVAGFSAAQIQRRTGAQVWIRVLPRVYRNAATPESDVGSRWAAVLWAGTPCVLSHTSAAAIWGVRGLGPGQPEVTVPRTRAPRAAGVVVHRVEQIAEQEVLHVGGLPVTCPVRTIIDLAGVLGVRDLEAALACMRSRRVLTVRAVRRRLDETAPAGRPGNARLRVLLASVGSGPVDPSARMAG